MRLGIIRLIVSAALAAAASIAAAQVNPSLVAPVCGQFTPLVVAGNHGSSFVHFFAKNCNKVLIGDQIETIPPGVGVLSGGVPLESKNAYIDKVPGQQMQPGTTYYAYAWCESYTPGCKMALNLSTTGAKESEDYGHQVHATDRTQTLVGMVRLMKDNLIAATPAQQPTISWNNRGHTGLALHFGNGQPRPRSCSNTPAPPEAIDSQGNVIPGYVFALEWLSFGINHQFTQAFTVPNVSLFGTATHSQTGGQAYFFLAGANGQTVSAPAYWQHSTANPAGSVFIATTGAIPVDEGYGKVQLLMSNGGTGGCVTLEFGTLYSSPLES